MNNDFYGLINRLDMAKEKIRSIETSQIKMHREKKCKNIHTHIHIREYPKSMGKSGKNIIRIPERKNCE